MDKKAVIEAFLRFAESKDIELGGIAVYGFGMESSDWRPLLHADYPNLISDFLVDQLTKENQQ